MANQIQLWYDSSLFQVDLERLRQNHWPIYEQSLSVPHLPEAEIGGPPLLISKRRPFLDLVGLYREQIVIQLFLEWDSHRRLI